MSLAKFNIKPSIYDIKSYVPGKSSLGQSKKIIKLSSNENSLGHSKKIIENKGDILANLNRYPDGSALELREKIAKLNNIDKNQLICGAGSDELIHLIIQAFCCQGDNIIYSQYGFLMYKIYAQSLAIDNIAVTETNYRANIDNIFAAINNKTRLIFIANPNNPTGSYLTYDELTILRNKIPDNIILVVDEAYVEYVEKSDYKSSFSMVRQYDNIIVTRTFSKIYGLASLRLGYAYAHKNIIEILNKIRSPFNITQSTQKAGCLAIEDQEFIQYSKKHNIIWLKKIEQFLDNVGISYLPSVANFILLDLQTKEEAIKFNNFLNNNSIIVRNVEEYGLENKVRITIGTEEENIKLINVIKKYKNE